MNPILLASVSLTLRARDRVVIKAIDGRDDFPVSEPPVSEIERLNRRMRGVLDRMGTAVEVAVVSAPPMAVAMTGAAIAEITAPKWTEEIADIFEPAIHRVFDAGGEKGAERIDFDEFDGEVPEIQQWIDTETTRLAEDVRDGTATRVRDLIADGLNEGKGVQGIAKELRERGFDPSRAEMIARTESNRAYNMGQIEAWKQSEIVTGKRWSLSPDACEFCKVAATSFESVALDRPFYALGSTLTAPSGRTMALDYASVYSPPLHPFCRCSILPVIGN